MNKLNLILILVSTVVFAQVASADYLVTESAPVYPGDTTYVYVPIQNQGGGSIYMDDVTVTLEPKDNASANAVKILDDMASLGTIDEWGAQRTARFRIYVYPDAVEGDYLFNVYINSTEHTPYSTTPPQISTSKLADQILTIRGIPLIVLANSTIGIVSPMSVNKESLKFRNSGTGVAKNVIAEINLENNSVFSILGGGKQFYLRNMKPGDEASITFDLAVDIAASPGVYNLPLVITGEDNYSSNNRIGLVVAGTTDFDVSYQETLGSFSLNVVNVGINPASAVTIVLPSQKNFTVTGPTSQVVGTLNPGDYTSAIFQVAKATGAGNTLELEVQYTDTSGERHSIPKSLGVVLSPAGTQSTRGSTNYTLWLVAVVIIIVAYWQRKRISSFFRKQNGGK